MVYDFDVEHYTSLDAVVFRHKKTGHVYNCNDETDMQILRNILCGRIKKLEEHCAVLEDRLDRIEKITEEKYQRY